MTQANLVPSFIAAAYEAASNSNADYKAFLEAYRGALPTHPELGDPALTERIVDTANRGNTPSVRQAAYRTLDVIAEARPDLLDNEMAVGVAMGAASGMQKDSCMVALNTARVIVEHRPDFAKAMRTVAKEVAARTWPNWCQSLEKAIDKGLQNSRRPLALSRVTESLLQLTAQ
ncbi:MAG: hypothetical protein WDO70_06545 [Alphaproteobacteria bacterium]